MNSSLVVSMKNVSLRNLLKETYEEIMQLFEKLYRDKTQLGRETTFSLIQRLQDFDLRNIDFDILGELHKEIQAREVRSSLGQFFTPPEIIRYIMSRLPLREFVLALEKEESPIILDPACGSGGFLVHFYNNAKTIMLERDWNHKDVTEALYNSIYGFDIDGFAVQLSTLNLVLKEKISDIGQLPSHVYTLDAVRTPLLGGERTSPELIHHKFTLIIGNPPFFEIKQFPGFATEYPMLLSNPKPNIASLFFLRYVQLLADDGILSFLLPASILFSDRFLDVRKYLLDYYTILEIVHLGRAFSEVGLEQIIIFVQNGRHEPGHTIRVVYDTVSLTEQIYKETSVLQAFFLTDRKFRFRIFMDEGVTPIIHKIEAKSGFLIDYAHRYHDRGRDRIAIFRGMGWERDLRRSRNTSHSLPALKGTNIMRYGIKNYYFLPNTRRPFNSRKFLLITSKPKIILQRLVSSRTRLVAIKDAKGIITISTIENLILKDDAPWNLDFVVGVLNSDLMALYVIDQIFMHSRLTTSIDQEYLGYLPIPLVGEERQEEIIKKVHELEAFTKLGIKAGREVKDIEDSGKYLALNRDLNRLVYSCYDLNDKEMSIIESRLTKFYNETSRG